MKHLTAIALLVLAYDAGGDEAKRLTWQFDGYAQLPDAARQAKRTGKRLLVGLAGSPT